MGMGLRVLLQVRPCKLEIVIPIRCGIPARHWFVPLLG